MSNLWLKILMMIVAGLSPEIRDLVVAFVRQLEERANQTANQMDNILVGLLKIVLGMK